MNSQIVDEAAEWFVTLRDGDGDPEQRARFSQWLLRSPEHVRTYLELTPIWAQAASAGATLPDAMSLIAQARAATNVVELPQGVDKHPTEPPHFMRGYRLAASVVAIATLAGLLSWAIGRPTLLTTDIGEQRSVALPDGSRIELNSRSRLQVRFSKHERTIELLEGQGFFEVASDPQRPFVVHSGDTRVRAVGTQFDVYRQPAGTVVTVVEGKVEAGTERAPPDTPGTLQLKAGEQATIADHGIVRAEKPNIEAATAWTHRQLVFDDATLDRVATEFNRYNFRRLVVRDAQLRTFRVSGVFSASDPTSLVQFLAEQPEISVEQSDTEVAIVKKLH